jgi:phosphoribosylanthranilate isomerase
MKDPGLAALALESGARYIGMIHHPRSPRHLSRDELTRLCNTLPQGCRVAVAVEPDEALIDFFNQNGVDRIQVHCTNPSPDQLTRWSALIGRERLWLAPKLHPDAPFPEWTLPHAGRWVIDTYAADAHGGTGKTGNWPAFRSWEAAYAPNELMLAGGITPENILLALRESHARFIDVNSGLESHPGQKDPEKIRRLFSILKSSHLLGGLK